MTSAPKIYTAPNYSPPLYYRLALQLAKPLYRLKVWQRSRHNATYKQEVNQRFGHDYPDRPMPSAVIWCHAVSLGETNTVAPLLNELLALGYGIWLTNTTQTGFDRAEVLFKAASQRGQFVHTFVPVDTPAVVARFLDTVRPVGALFVETELWPVMLAQLNTRNIPAIMVNARLSAKSYNNYQRFASISHNMMTHLSLVIAQNSDTAKRFRRLRLDSNKIRIAESLKWSVGAPSAQLRQVNNATAVTDTADTPDTAVLEADDLYNVTDAKVIDAIANRPVWVAASTHAGEEAMVIKAHQKLVKQAKLADALLILVPRHPERFDTVAQLLVDANIPFARRSYDEPITAQTQVYLADTMGELMHWYKLADVAMVGGSLVNIGGHNPIEAARLGAPIIMGPYTQTSQLLVNELASIGALIQLLPHNADNTDRASSKPSKVTEATEAHTTQLTDALYRAVQSWLSTPILAIKSGERGQKLVMAKQGAVRQQLEMILPFLPPVTAPITPDSAP